MAGVCSHFAHTWAPETAAVKSEGPPTPSTPSKSPSRKSPQTPKIQSSQGAASRQKNVPALYRATWHKVCWILGNAL